MKIYVSEPGSAEIDRLLRGRTDLLVSDLAITDVTSALSRQARQGSLSTANLRLLYQTILDELERDTFIKVDLTEETHRLAERFLLAVEHGSLRASDSLHLALAVASEAKTLFTTDRHLGEVAQAIGLAIRP